jgi:hypothetical protein
VTTPPPTRPEMIERVAVELHRRHCSCGGAATASWASLAKTLVDGRLKGDLPGPADHEAVLDAMEIPHPIDDTPQPVTEWEIALHNAVTEISYKSAWYVLDLRRDLKDDDGRWFLQVRVWRRDTVTGDMGWGKGGKRYLSEHMTVSEVVRVAYGLFAAYEEHECREGFKFSGRRVFGPHIDVNALWEVANKIDARPSTN